ncbi:MAG: 1-deoxy-D-xylulose-5-phosphate synthase [Spirochaetales bacterium]|nr:1-deoxy-D-xylulose-5-phosphate synthase [Spirochaetales bacterium]
MNPELILSKINSPHDIKKLNKNQLKNLAKEIRSYIIDVISQTGGHLASNLGAIELTLALHYVFNSPEDKIIWDVGHQCYTHKIITGRRDQLKNIRKKNGISGFPKQKESPHDIFDTGHSSTSISAALGLKIGQNILQNNHKVIAVIGDGSLTGGMAFEALNHAGHLGKHLIVIINDNGMSISKNVGALSAMLTNLTATRSYQLFRRNFDRVIKKIMGNTFLKLINRIKKMFKALVLDTNLFADLGFEYIGPVNGHNINDLIIAFEHIHNFDKPVVIHVNTQKGKGYHFAENDPTSFHGVGAFSVIDGKLEPKTSLSFTEAFSQSLLNQAKANKKICAITAAMASGTGLTNFEQHFPKRFFDVGITEQHAITFSAGLAKAGLKPVVAIYSTFMQRAVDQVIHDVALQKLPVIIVMDRAGIVGADGETHHGLFDIALFRAVPDTIFLSPGNAIEMDLMLDYALKQNLPVLMRYPRANCIEDIPHTADNIEEGKGVFIQHNQNRILVMTLGTTLEQTTKLSHLLALDEIKIDIYNMRFINPIDENYLLSILKSYDQIYFIEEGYAQGGLGEYISSFIARNNLPVFFHYFAFPSQFIEHASREEIFEEYGMSPSQMAMCIKENSKYHNSWKVIKRSEPS